MNNSPKSDLTANGRYFNSLFDDKKIFEQEFWQSQWPPKNEAQTPVSPVSADTAFTINAKVLANTTTPGLSKLPNWPIQFFFVPQPTLATDYWNISLWEMTINLLIVKFLLNSAKSNWTMQIIYSALPVVHAWALCIHCAVFTLLWKGSVFLLIFDPLTVFPQNEFHPLWGRDIWTGVLYPPK